MYYYCYYYYCAVWGNCVYLGNYKVTFRNMFEILICVVRFRCLIKYSIRGFVHANWVEANHRIIKGKNAHA